jgi:DNA-binding NtrC family response regulator
MISVITTIARRPFMDRPILVVDADKEQCQELCCMLEERHYRTIPIYSMSNLHRWIQESGCIVVLLDIDTISVDNRVVRELTVKNPGVYFLALSKHRYNPELRDAICYHIYACMNKPVDPDELFYLLKSIYQDEADIS